MAKKSKLRTQRSICNIPSTSPIRPSEDRGVFLFLRVHQLQPGDFVLLRMRKEGKRTGGPKVHDIMYRVQKPPMVQQDADGKLWSINIPVMYLDGVVNWRRWDFGDGEHLLKECPLLPVFRPLAPQKKSQKPSKKQREKDACQNA